MHIFIDRLKKEEVLHIKEETPSAFLEISEPELSFKDPVHISGKAYIVEDHLILQFNIQTTCDVPCCICNTLFTKNINIQSFYHAQPLEELKLPIFDYSLLVREAILLELPAFTECNAGNCPERTCVSKYLSTSNSFPFQDLKIDKKEPPHIQ